MKLFSIFAGGLLPFAFVLLAPALIEFVQPRTIGCY
jgi:hypothetical protein